MKTPSRPVRKAARVGVSKTATPNTSGISKSEYRRKHATMSSNPGTSKHPVSSAVGLNAKNSPIDRTDKDQ